jgi:hypothetical protein
MARMLLSLYSTKTHGTIDISGGIKMKSYTDQISKWDKIMMAITFAEVGEAKTARDMLNQRTGKQQQPESRTRKESGKRPQLRV